MGESSIVNKKAVSLSSTAKRVTSLVMGEVVIVILIGFIFKMMMWSGLIVGVYIDAWSALAIIGMTLAVLAATGLLKEFGHAFSYCVQMYLIWLLHR